MTKLHTFIQAHIEAQFPGCEVICATNPNEQWVAIIIMPDGQPRAYVAQMDGDSEGLSFLRKGRITGQVHDFDVILTDDEMMDAVRETHTPFQRLPDSLQTRLVDFQAEDVRDDPKNYAGELLHHEDLEVIDLMVVREGGDWCEDVDPEGEGAATGWPADGDAVAKAIREACTRRLVDSGYEGNNTFEPGTDEYYAAGTLEYLERLEGLARPVDHKDTMTSAF